MHRAAPVVADASGEDPYGYPLVPHGGAEEAPVRRCHGRQECCTTKWCDDQVKRRDPYTRCADEARVYGSRVYKPFRLMFQASAYAPAVERCEGRQGRKGHKGTWQQWSCGRSLRSPSPLRSEALLVGIADRFLRLAPLARTSGRCAPSACPALRLREECPPLPTLQLSTGGRRSGKREAVVDRLALRARLLHGGRPGDRVAARPIRNGSSS